ncbi:MAG: hypothetical protein M1818_005478 [Claussenomyces sp. TS43310]|nr:MAG: hypothetical protein M1818_005478 [Claussenomyces sp. TS43310]
MRFSTASACRLALGPTLALVSVVTAGSFTYDCSNFYLNGDVYQIIGGQMEPQHIPYQLWSDRLAKARAMGLNTIFTYVPWYQLEPSPGVWDYTGSNNISQYFQLAQSHGLNVVLRPGPYIDAEQEWGGFPA